MLQDNYVTASKASLISNICSGFRNIFYTFSSNYKQNIPVLKIFGTANRVSISM